MALPFVVAVEQQRIGRGGRPPMLVGKLDVDQGQEPALLTSLGLVSHGTQSGASGTPAGWGGQHVGEGAAPIDPDPPARA